MLNVSVGAASAANDSAVFSTEGRDLLNLGRSLPSVEMTPGNYWFAAEAAPTAVNRNYIGGNNANIELCASAPLRLTAIAM